MEDLINKLHQRIDAINLEVKHSFSEILDTVKSQDEKIDIVREKTEILESAVHTLRADTTDTKEVFYTMTPSPTSPPDQGDGRLPRPPVSSALWLALAVMSPDQPDSPLMNHQCSGNAQVMVMSATSREVFQDALPPLEAMPVSVLSMLAVVGYDRFTPTRCSTKCSGNYNTMMMPRSGPCVSPSDALLLASAHLNTMVSFVRVRVCTRTKGVATHVWFDEVLEQDEVGWRLWPYLVQVCIRTKERMPWLVPCPSFADDFASLQLKIPWLLLRIFSNIVVLIRLVMNMFQHCFSQGLTITVCADPESHVSRSLGNHHVSFARFLANDLDNPCALLCLEGVLWVVEIWCPELQGVQQWDPGIHLVGWWLSTFCNEYFLATVLQLENGALES